ncbi:helix-turn-helix domain-containing protein [Hazenella sp. IB182357]|uniref:Helix-turn-helix domain-containing protein n=1 Tax=Polycladospora coralii TaxID=2771432 RepID=A0A926N803_9BACL|nr:helix-turn-helix domain-containing protein [Polycladospora coralii]MBD1371258.1 helix-turn-helix domain-containing protein [Polycladospora coralii]
MHQESFLSLLRSLADLNEKVLQLTQRMEQPSSESLTYSVEQTAKILGISRSKLYDLLHRPDFPVVDIGHRKLIPRRQLEQWLDQQLQNGCGVNHLTG